MDAGSQPIADPAALRQVRRQARIVHIKSLLATAALTAIVVALP